MKRPPLLKYLSFGSAALVVVVLMVATILEKFYGTHFVLSNIYGSRLMIALWLILAHCAVLYLVSRMIYKRLVTFMLHISFAVILFGAYSTWEWGVQGKMHLREGEPIEGFTTTDNEEHQLPFSITLRAFELRYYEGTFAPMDYISHIEIVDGGERIEGEVSMNNILSHRHYRLYQAGYDKDGNGATLSVSYDPWGIGITYTGYALLLISMLAFFLQSKSRFRQLLQHPALKRVVSVVVLMFCITNASAKTMPHTVPRDVADKFGELHIYYNDRVCPLQTFAIDFTTKLYGKSTYRGMSAEQVVLGWFFFYDDWKREPMIKIKGGETKQLLGIEGNYACLTDFASATEGYKLESALRGEGVTNRRNAESANEKFNLVSMLAMGNLLKIYPYRDGEGVVTWYSLADKLPAEVPYDKWLFIGRSMNLVAEKIMLKKYDEVVAVVEKIGKYQTKEADNSLPPSWRMKAEQLYNGSNIIRPLAMACMTLGIVLFLIFCLNATLPRKRWFSTSLAVGLGLIFLYLTLQIGFRWIVSDHIPLSNGFETMQFMAWCSALISLLAMHKYRMALPFGYLLCGFTLLVAMMGSSTPQVTQLMPVLQSPLLSIHVVVIMIAYSLLAFTMLNGITAVVIRYTKHDFQTEVKYLQLVSNIMLYPAVFLLAIGIFVGAVWANISWGRYWGWDPKETWALITMLVYSAALHTSSLGYFRRPMFFHTFMIVAFLTVLITYFGVNFLLGGMHSYA